MQLACNSVQLLSREEEHLSCTRVAFPENLIKLMVLTLLGPNGTRVARELHARFARATRVQLHATPDLKAQREQQLL